MCVCVCVCASDEIVFAAMYMAYDHNTHTLAHTPTDTHSALRITTFWDLDLLSISISIVTFNDGFLFVLGLVFFFFSSLFFFSFFVSLEIKG